MKFWGFFFVIIGITGVALAIIFPMVFEAIQEPVSILETTFPNSRTILMRVNRPLNSIESFKIGQEGKNYSFHREGTGVLLRFLLEYPLVANLPLEITVLKNNSVIHVAVVNEITFTQEEELRQNQETKDPYDDFKNIAERYDVSYLGTANHNNQHNFLNSLLTEIQEVMQAKLDSMNPPSDSGNPPWISTFVPFPQNPFQPLLVPFQRDEIDKEWISSGEDSLPKALRLNFNHPFWPGTITVSLSWEKWLGSEESRSKWEEILSEGTYHLKGTWFLAYDYWKPRVGLASLQLIDSESNAALELVDQFYGYALGMDPNGGEWRVYSSITEEWPEIATDPMALVLEDLPQQGRLFSPDLSFAMSFRVFKKANADDGIATSLVRIFPLAQPLMMPVIKAGDLLLEMEYMRGAFTSITSHGDEAYRDYELYSFSGGSMAFWYDDPEHYRGSLVGRDESSYTLRWVPAAPPKLDSDYGDFLPVPEKITKVFFLIVHDSNNDLILQEGEIKQLAVVGLQE